MFKENLKRARIFKGYGQFALAEKLGITQASLSQFETGYRSPSISTLKKIGKIFGMSLKELTGNDEGVLGRAQLMGRIKGLSLNSLGTLNKMAEFLRSEEQKGAK